MVDVYRTPLLGDLQWHIDLVAQVDVNRTKWLGDSQLHVHAHVLSCSRHLGSQRTAPFRALAATGGGACFRLRCYGRVGSQQSAL